MCARRGAAVGQDMPMTDGGTGAADGETGAAATDTAPKPDVPFGAWPSPITSADVARSGLRLSFPTIIGGDVWWQEMRPDEGGRSTVVCQAAGGKQTELLPAPWNARTRVHEYGGLAYLPVPRPAAPGSAARAGQPRPRRRPPPARGAAGPGGGRPPGGPLPPAQPGRGAGGPGGRAEPGGG